MAIKRTHQLTIHMPAGLDTRIEFKLISRPAPRGGMSDDDQIELGLAAERALAAELPAYGRILKMQTEQLMKLHEYTERARELAADELGVHVSEVPR